MVALRLSQRVSLSPPGGNLLRADAFGLGRPPRLRGAAAALAPGDDDGDGDGDGWDHLGLQGPDQLPEMSWSPLALNMR